MVVRADRNGVSRAAIDRGYVMSSEQHGVAAKELEKLGGVIPSLYYDIIARIIPGCVLIAAFAWNGESTINSLLKDATFGSGFFFLLGGYVVGMLLTTIALFFDFVWWMVAKRRPCELLSPWEAALLIDKIGHINPTAGITLFKMFAEVTFFENLLAGLIVFWAARIHLSVPLDHPNYCVLHLAVGIVVFLGLVFRIAGLVERIKSHRDLLHV
jgi:hypothetical protein